MADESKHRCIKYIRELSKLNSKIDLREAIDIEERLNEERRKSHIMWVIVVASMVITVAVLVLLFLKSFGVSRLSDSATLALAIEVVVAVFGYMGVIVRHYWYRGGQW